jgi:hypothetical protein
VGSVPRQIFRAGKQVRGADIRHVRVAEALLLERSRTGQMFDQSRLATLAVGGG